MTILNRRAFLGVTPFAVGAALQTFAVFNTGGDSVRLTASLGAGGYGGLRAAKARNTGEEILTLPEGFEYNVIGKTGAKMSDGNLTLAAHDEKIFDFAKNILPGYEGKEFAGAAFSPDGRTLFVNTQTPGMTLAIWGSWDRGALQKRAIRRRNE